jgi:hypothetical protein
MEDHYGYLPEDSTTSTNTTSFGSRNKASTAASYMRQKLPIQDRLDLSDTYGALPVVTRPLSKSESQLRLSNYAALPKKTAEWRQCKSESGQIYYWNTVTNETSWKKPEESASSVLLPEKSYVTLFVNFNFVVAICIC